MGQIEPFVRRAQGLQPRPPVPAETAAGEIAGTRVLAGAEAVLAEIQRVHQQPSVPRQVETARVSGEENHIALYT